MIELDLIRIDGGTRQNYVVEFADGVCKVGVTGRPRARLAELARQHGVAVTRAAFAKPLARESAYGLERNMCRLLAYRRRASGREWLQGGADAFDHLRQTMGMFWHLVPGARGEYLDKEVMA